MLERKLHDGPSPLFEAAPRPRRSRPALRERIPSPEVAPRPPNRDLALRVHIPSSEPESRFSSLNRASRIRIPLPGLAFRSSGSRSTPWACSRSPDSNLASRLAFRPPNPNSAPPVHTLLCEPKCRSFGSRSPSKLECRTFGSCSLSEPEFRPICQALEAALPHFALSAPSHLALPAPDVSRETFVRT